MSFQAYIDNVEAKTGQSAADLKAIATERKLADENGLAPGVKAGAIIDWICYAIVFALLVLAIVSMATLTGFLWLVKTGRMVADLFP